MLFAELVKRYNAANSALKFLQDLEARDSKSDENDKIDARLFESARSRADIAKVRMF